MKKLFTNALCVLSALFLLWIAVSFIEVNAKNTKPNPDYWDYNFFIVMTEWSEAVK